MKHFVLSLLLFAFALGVFATNVELQDARNIALNAYYEKVNLYLKPVNLNELQISEFFTIQKDGEPMLFIFNFENLGNIIISADDAMTPVIGYSFESQYNPEKIADNFSGWLNSKVGEVKYVKENNILPSENIISKWENYANPQNISLKGGGKSIEPLLTSTWNQDWPYNYYCPLDAGGSGGRVYVGCVATAMAQIMLYWRYPNQGNSSKSFFQYPYGTLSANFGETTYNWNGMVDNSDQKINLPMALIGYHAAISVSMDFGPDGSGALSDSVPIAMRKYFGYDPTIQKLSKTSGTSWSTWRGYIEDELNLHRPLYYAGRDAQYPDPSNGHAFVLDGSHSDGTYHFNFGWSGYGNGWFDIESASGYEWYYYQVMVKNIFPADDTYPYGCNPDFVETNLLGSIEDGSGPQESYDQNVNCSWLIDPQSTSDSVTKITMNFVFLDTETDDVITIYDGETNAATVLGTFSGPTIPGSSITSTGNKVLITFTADGDAYTGEGFRIEYETTQPTWCSGLTLLTATSGIINDGSDNWYYKNNSSCIWKIQPQWSSNLTLTFTEFNTEEGVDMVTIKDASNNQTIATYSGQYTSGNMPSPITVPSGKLILVFTSDGAVNGPGWTAEWQVANTAVEEQDAGFDQLMVFPNPTENLLNISFNVEQNQSLVVRLISATGTVVYTENAKDFSGYYINTIDLSGFAKGVYFLNITNNDGTVNKKVIVK